MISKMEQVISQQMEIQNYCLYQSQKNYDDINEKLQKTLHQIHYLSNTVKRFKDKLPNEPEQLEKVEIKNECQWFKSMEKKSYQFRLILQDRLELPIYRNKKFSINLLLTSVQGQPFENSNSVKLELMIFTHDPQPRKIRTNNKGWPIISGNNKVELIKGKAIFKKILINEISSHFPQQKFKILIAPLEEEETRLNDSTFVSKEQIQPFQIHDLIVKAKKFSERHVPIFINQDGTVQE